MSWPECRHCSPDLWSGFICCTWQVGDFGAAVSQTRRASHGLSVQQTKHFQGQHAWNDLMGPAINLIVASGPIQKVCQTLAEWLLLVTRVLMQNLMVRQTNMLTKRELVIWPIRQAFTSREAGTRVRRALSLRLSLTLTMLKSPESADPPTDPPADPPAEGGLETGVL